MNFGNRNQSTWLVVVGCIALFACVFVLAMLMHGLSSLLTGNWGSIHWRDVLNSVLLFAVLGAYYGAIAALDSASGMADADRPIIRTILCGFLAAVAVLLVQAWPPQTFNMIGPLLGFFIGASLGWVGWRWAKYVDF
jgi:hypothetical protein